MRSATPAGSGRTPTGSARFPSKRYGTLHVVVTDETPKEGDAGFAGDHLVIHIRSPKDAELGAHTFVTSYGKFSLDLIDLDDDGEVECVVVSGMGRGTGVRSESLQVLCLGKGVLHARLSTPYSAYFGSGAWWGYKRRFIASPATRSTDIHLTLQHTAIGAGGLERPEYIPVDRQRVISVRCGKNNPQQDAPADAKRPRR